MSISFIQFLVEAQTKKKKGYVVEYHDTLSPKIWGSNNKLKPKVRKAMLAIAAEFFDFLKVDDFAIKDIYFTGSMCNYNYTSKSDIDIHLLLDYKKTAGEKCGIDLYDVFMTKKQLWAELHDITIYGYPVELYVQSVDEKLMATGIYSAQDNKWIAEPKHEDTLIKDVNTYAVMTKVRDYKKIIDKVIADKVDDYEAIKRVKDKIKAMRQGGLEKAGEFSVENLAFKKLRNDGDIERLFDYSDRIRDERLTLECHNIVI